MIKEENKQTVKANVEYGVAYTNSASGGKGESIYSKSFDEAVTHRAPPSWDIGKPDNIK